MRLIILNLTNPEIRKNYKGQIITDHYGRKVPKHAILKGMNLQEGATAIERNHQIGGHKA